MLVLASFHLDLLPRITFLAPPIAFQAVLSPGGCHGVDSSRRVCCVVVPICGAPPPHANATPLMTTPAATRLNRDVHPFLVQAIRQLRMSNGAFGVALGSSKRTAARWLARESTPSVPQVVTLARLVYPKDAALAATLAAAASTSLEALGLRAAPRAPLSGIATTVIVDAVVLSAADAMASAPGVARKGLRAAFARARALGIDLVELEKSLASEATA